MGERRVRIGLVGCVKQKLDREAAARELYVSDLFRGRRHYVERTCDRWYILSAKHHLVPPDEIVAPYDVTLQNATESERRRWSRVVLDALRDELGDLSRYEFELHAGNEYRSYGLRDGLDRAGAPSVYPVAGLRYAEQVQFYREQTLDAVRDPSPESLGAPAVAGMVEHPERAREVARRLWTAWNGPGVFGERTMPEDRLPDGLVRGSRTHAAFVTLTVAIDYMRDAGALWEASRRAYADERTRWLFDAAAIERAGNRAVLAALVATGVALRPQRDARIWQGIASALARRFHGDPRAIAVEAGYRGPAMIAELRRTPGEFPSLRGDKIAPLWLRMMVDTVGLPILELDQVPIPVDVHIARATYSCGALTGSLRSTVSSAAPAIQALWTRALRDDGIYPLQIDQALWRQSREGCSRRRGNICPREDECVIADLCVAGRIHVSADALVIDTRVLDAVPQPPPGPPARPIGIDPVWHRVSRHAGEPGFLTRTGVDITYDVTGDVVIVRGIRGGQVTKAALEQALLKVPLHAVQDVPADLWGRSYIFAILMDDRIRGTDW